MKNISEIYDKYKIMPNLQEHMLRVAAVATLVCNNFNEALPKEEIVTACLLHDMGNIIKFKLDYFPEFLQPEGLEYWQQVQNDYIAKYNKNEHVAHEKIAKEIGVNQRVIELINAISFLDVSKLVEEPDFSKKIVQYCDDRVGPFGVVSLEGRFMDLRKRYEHIGKDTPERRAFESSLKKIEKQIFAKCKIKPEDVNDETIKTVIAELKNFVIK